MLRRAIKRTVSRAWGDDTLELDFLGRYHASRDANASYERVVSEILREAEETDRREHELCGEARGDELPEQLCTRAGRRAAFREAKRELDAEREAQGDGGQASDDEPIVALDLDRERRVNSEQGRRGWLREGRRQLDELRRQQARPIARFRTERLREAKRRLEEEHRVELKSNAAYEAYRTRGVMKTDDGSADRLTRTPRRHSRQGRSTPRS